MNKKEENEMMKSTPHLPAIQQYLGFRDFNRTRSFNYTQDISLLKPQFCHFDTMLNGPNLTFPYQMFLCPGNHSDLILRIAKIRGYVRTEGKLEESLQNVDFIWKPTQFSSKVLLILRQHTN